MRAKPTRSQESTKTEATGTVADPELTDQDIRAGDGEVVDHAPRKAVADAKQLHWYEVTRGGRVSQEGMQSRIPVGKVLHDGAYNIDLLKRQGIGLRDLGFGPATGPVEQPTSPA